MASSAAVWLVLLIAVDRSQSAIRQRTAVHRRPEPGTQGDRLAPAGTLLALWGVTLAIGFALEARAGQIQPQGWEFYAALGFTFLTFAFPGFVWRYLRRGR